MAWGPSNGLPGVSAPTADISTGTGKTPDVAAFAEDALPNIDLASQNPYTDNSYNSFLRGYGMDGATAQAEVARKRSQLNQQLSSQAPVWADRLNEGLGRIGYGAAERGTFRSGERLQAQSRFQRDETRQRQASETGVANQLDDLNANLQETLNGLARQRAEQEQAARTRLAVQAIQDWAS